MIAFMGEERVLRGGDNVLVAATEASLSEIKHDEPGPRDARGVRRKLHLALEIFFAPSLSSSPAPISSAAFIGFGG